MLENSANVTAPANPLIGQIWYNSSTKLLNVCTNNNPVTWTPLTTGVSQVCGLNGTISLTQLTAPGLLAPNISPALTGTPTTSVPTGNVANQIATVGYVQNMVATVVGGVSSVVGANGQVTLAQLVAGRVAPLDSPAFAGIPTAPQPTVGNNSQQIATTSFVLSQVAAMTSGVASVVGANGIVTLAQLTAGGVAPLDQPVFTTSASAPQPPINDNSALIATTAFVTTKVGNLLTSINTWWGQQAYALAPYFSGGMTATGLDAGNVHFRAIAGTYAAMLRNDGTSFSILATNSIPTPTVRGAPNLLLTATYNTLRPFTFNMASGAVTIDGTGCGTTMGGTLAVGGSITTSGHLSAGLGVTGINAANNPTVVPVLADFHRTLGAAGEMYCSLPGGLVLQTGQGITLSGEEFVSFPTPFPNMCIQVLVGEANPSGWAAGTNPTIFGSQQLSASNFALYVTHWVPASASWTITAGIGYRWIAIGY